MNFKDSPEWQLGEIAVGSVRQWLLNRGEYLLPTDQIEMGGAPGFIGPHGRITVPDLLAASRGKTRWWEVKWKTSCVLHQRTRTWRHGVDVYNWDHYLYVQNLTSIPGRLAIVQLRPGPEAKPDPCLLVAPFDLLDDQKQPHDGSGDIKVWWDVDVFNHHPIASLGDGWERINIRPRLIRPWEGKDRFGNPPKWNGAA